MSTNGFGLEHLPYGVFSTSSLGPRVGVRLGDEVLDLYAATGRPWFEAPSLNAFLRQGPEVWATTRAELPDLLGSNDLLPLDRVDLHLPIEVADYVDFYASEQHARNVGAIFRPDSPGLPTAWKHLPIGYHGRAGTVVPSGTAIRRPRGQRLEPGETAPTFGPSLRLDLEAELGFVVGMPSELGSPVSTADFARHVFGVTLLNDWSARDLQAFEYVPLGPFLGKSFATSISPWITPLAALEPFRCELPRQQPTPLPHLQVDGPAGYDLALEVVLNGEVVSRPEYASTYWGPAQMLAHLTSNGAGLRTGDVFASGTVSGPRPEQRGSFLELSWGGAEPFGTGVNAGHTFLQDGDEVTLRASAGAVTLGEVAGRIAPAG